MRPRSIVTTALLASAAFATPAPAAVVSPAGVRFPELAVNATGATIVAWERRTSSAFAVEVRTGDSPRSLGRIHRFAGRSYRPKVAIGADGTRAVMWFEDKGDRVGVLRVAVARPGRGFGKPRLLERRRGMLAPSGVAVQSDGRVVAVWRRGSSRLIFALAPRDRGFGAARYLTFLAPSSEESMAVDPRDGAVVLAYGTPVSVAQLGNPQAAARTLETTATSFSAQAILSDPASLTESRTVAVAGSGGAGLTYIRSGNVRELYLVRRTGSGTWAPPQLVAKPAPGPGMFALTPIGTLPADGSALVAWPLVNDPRELGATSSQIVASIAQPGAAFGAPTALTPPNETYGASAIASAGAEAFLATAKAHGPLLLATRPAGGGALQTRTVTADGDGDVVLAAAGSHVLLAYQQADRLRLHTIR